MLTTAEFSWRRGTLICSWLTEEREIERALEEWKKVRGGIVAEDPMSLGAEYEDDKDDDDATHAYFAKQRGFQHRENGRGVSTAFILIFPIPSVLVTPLSSHAVDLKKKKIRGRQRGRRRPRRQRGQASLRAKRTWRRPLCRGPRLFVYVPRGLMALELRARRFATTSSTLRILLGLLHSFVHVLLPCTQTEASASTVATARELSLWRSYIYGISWNLRASFALWVDSQQSSDCPESSMWLLTNQKRDVSSCQSFLSSFLT